MPFIATQATYKIAELRKRIRAVQGGTSAGKTIGIEQVLIDLALTDETPTLTSIVSESFPHLKRGAMRDFLNILQEQNYYKEDQWNRTDSIYTFKNKSKIEFFGADAADKVRGPRRDRLFVNEANNIPYNTFEQLEVRTKETIFLDWNPTNEFWFDTELKPSRKEDIDHIIVTYKDNEGLSPEIVKSIESRKEKKHWWQVYGMGLLGEAEGRIYTGWEIIDEIPHEARLERYGLDFGYSNDPTAIVAKYYYNGGYIFDEICYTKGLSNRQIFEILDAVSPALVMADSAEPKSIDEIKSYGVNILPVTKGKDSVVQGIQYVQDQRISLTKQSTNLIKEYRNYMWEEDKDGHRLNVPEDQWNHALDAVRYSFDGMRQTVKDPVIVGYTEGLGGIMIPEYDFD